MMMKKGSFKRLKFALVIFSLFFIEFNVNATEKLTLTSKVMSFEKSISNTYHYQITASNKNPAQASYEPTSVVAEFKDSLVKENKMAIVKTEIDFSNTKYSKPGIYSYIVKEVSTSDSNKYPVSNEEYEIYVQVEYDENNVLKKNVYLQALDLKTKEKMDLVFNHNIHHTHIIIKQILSGDFKNSNEYFKYKLIINGNPGSKYFISGQDDIVFFDGNRLRTTSSYIVKPDNNYVYIYLRNDQTVTIGIENGVNQIPVGTTYYLSKIGSRKWKTIINNEEVTSTNFKIAKLNPNDNQIIIVEEKKYDVALTGVFLNIFPFIILIILAIIIFIISKKLKIKSDDNENNK